jgi:uncharacterized protein (TIGR04255 family)
MTSTLHPSYENPTIQEALCDILFELPEGVAWDRSWYGEFYKHIQDQFPTFQPVSFPVLVEVSNRPRGSNLFAVPQAIRFHHVSRNLLLQLHEARIVVNLIGDYPGWERMREDIKLSWNAVCDVIKPANINRLTLRYINRVEQSKAKETGDSWFKSSDFISVAALRSIPPVVSRMETKTDDFNGTNVIFTHQEVETSRFGAFLLDIERFTEAKLGVETDVLHNEVTRLHDDVWEVFTSTKNERLERLLQGELP